MSKRLGFGVLFLLLSLSLGGCFFLLISDPEILYEEDFGPDANWYVGTSENRTWWIEDGEYHVLIHREDISYGSQQSNTGPFGDFKLDIDAGQLAGPNDNGYGVQFRMKDAANYYRFCISGDGYARFSKKLNGTVTNIIAWEPTDLIHQGVAVNHLSIRAEGRLFTFYINGTEWNQASDASLAIGHVGVMGIMFSSPGPTHIAFDHLIIQALE